MNSPLSHKKDLRTHLTLEPNMRAAGLINIQHTKIQLPLTGWSPGKMFQSLLQVSRLFDEPVLAKHTPAFLWWEKQQKPGSDFLSLSEPLR